MAPGRKNDLMIPTPGFTGLKNSSWSGRQPKHKNPTKDGAVASAKSSKLGCRAMQCNAMRFGSVSFLRAGEMRICLRVHLVG